ncbi:MAG: aldehyde ferredoxin oxidoreductase family protein [Candidatus Aerophobetes bacterium]
MYGWQGKILKVDLSRERIETVPLTEELRTNFIGGRGINAKILFDELKRGTGGFDPDNVLIFGSGPLSGTLAPGAGRFNVSGKSPLGFLGDSNCGGHWAPELKFSGFDHVLIRGKAKKPVYLLIRDGEAKLVDARHLWGLDTWRTQRSIRKELRDPGVEVACIGQAGENLVRLASIRTSLKHSAARGGMGAVMGSKNLKAIVVRGTQGVKIAHPEKFLQATKKCTELLKTHSFQTGFQAGDTAGTYGKLWSWHHTHSKLGTKHHQAANWEDADKLSPRLFHSQYRTKMLGDFSCPVQCLPRFRIKDGPYRGLYGEGPEFESIVSFGSMCLNTDLASVIKATELTNRYGLDCDSTGRTIAFAMELYERGIITDKDIGFPLRWGDSQAIIRMVELIAKREGFGNILAEGELRAAQEIGRGAEKFALTIKGLELHESFRGSGAGHALGHSTSTRGSDHLRSSHHAEHDLSSEEAEKFYGYREAADRSVYEHKEKQVIYNEYSAALADMLEVCKFFGHWASPYCIDADLFAEVFSAATGIKMSGKDMLKAAERVYNVERAFIVREGARRKDDYPPDREFEDPLPSGPMRGSVLDRRKYDALLTRYYIAHGWDKKDGIPTREKLEELELRDVAKALEKALGEKV